MRHTAKLCGVAALLCLVPFLGLAQQSIYDVVNFASDWNGWDPSRGRMELISNGLWRTIIFLHGSVSNRFKFTANDAWTLQWGELNQTSTVPPFEGYAEQVSGSGNDIAHAPVVEGYYQVTFHESTHWYRLEPLGHAPPWTNLLRNAGFETAGTASGEALYWEWAKRLCHGGRWGNSFRVDWRAHDGVWEAAVGSSYGGAPNYGGWWQEAAGGVGFIYEARVWHWADAVPPYGPWSAGVQRLKIEQYSPTLQLLGEFSAPVIVTDLWGQTTLTVTGLPNVAWIRWVLDVSQTGDKGALQIDAAELLWRYPRAQSFDVWGGLGSVAYHPRGGWVLATGQIVQAGARTTYGASLANPSGGTNAGGYVQSPRFAEGLGSIHFWYRHGHADTNTEPQEPVSLRVETSFDGINWVTLDTLTNITALYYRPYDRFVYETNAAGFRIVHAGGSTNPLLLDDIVVALPQPISRYQDFNDWPDAGTNLGCHESIDWVVCTGQVSSVNAWQGKSARLPGPGVFSNYVRTPFFSNGFGTISFEVARGTNGSAPAVFELQSSFNGATWSTVATSAPIADTSYGLYSCYLYEPSGAYVRIVNAAYTSAGPATLLLDEEFNNAPSPPPGWTFYGITEAYTLSRMCGRNPPSLKFDNTNDRVETPTLSNPTNLSFWINMYSADTNSSLLVQGLSNVTWVTLALVTNIANTSTGTTVNIALSTNITKVRFTYTKVASNLGFDDVIIHGLPQAAQPPQDLLLDNILVGLPELHRAQDFDAWPATSSYGDSEFQGWRVEDAIIDDRNPRSGQSARLSATVSDLALVRSPRLPEGIGAITFWYAVDEANPPSTMALSIQISSNGTDWLVLDSLRGFTNMAYEQYCGYYYLTNYFYVQIVHTGGARRIALDDIEIALPAPPADVALSGWHEPESPFTNDAVTILGRAMPLYGAANLALTSFYRIGTSGAFTAIGMQPSGLITYRSTSPIPPQAVGTVVEYYISCHFTGPGSLSNSPRFYPPGGSNNPAWYGLPRAPAGYVWINEIKYVTLWGNEFVELAGAAGRNISDWTLEFYWDTNGYQPVLYDRYRIPSPTILSNEYNGYGFWVLGQSGVAQRDMTFTNWMTSHLPTGIRLLNEMGGLEYALCVNGTLPRFDRIPVSDDDWWPALTGVCLIGTGGAYTNFSWSATNATPGAPNFGQILQAPTGAVPPEVWFLSIVVRSNVTLWTTGTNAWSPRPFYTTNLAAANPQWIEITSFNSTYANGTNRIWFPFPVVGPNCFFRVILQQD